MHHTARRWSVLVLCLAAGVQAREAVPKPVKDYWDAAYVEGVKAGHFHTVVVETERDGKKFYKTTQVMNLKVRRDMKVVEVTMENSVEETPDGKVVGVGMSMLQGPAKLALTGRVEGDKLVVFNQGGQELKRLPWDDTALGLYAQERVWKDKKVKPGDRFDFTTFELGLEKALTMRVVVKEMEDTVILEATKADPKEKVERVKRSLLRAEGLPDKVEIGGAPLQLPRVITWLDSDYNVLRMETQLPGLGQIVSYRTTKVVATEETATPALLPDLLQTTLIPLDKAIDRPYDRAEVVYRITMTGDDDPTTTFARDRRQAVENVTEKGLNLRVRAQRSRTPLEQPEKVSDDYRKPNHFLDSNDEAVKALAAQAIGAERDPLLKARRIEKWAHDNLTVTNEVVFARASQVARDRKGDCRQFALLTAAMCRAAGLPSRTALGLVYTVDAAKGPVLAFHMWTEVYVVDQWLALDAILGIGGVGPTHLKVADLSWHDTQTLAPMLSVMRVLEKVKVEVVAVK
jgi:hypothetical protein